MKVLLIDIDSKIGFPNLALMKISTWHKLRGDDVFLSRCFYSSRLKNLEQKDRKIDPDIVYISCIFTKNKDKALGIANLWKAMGKEVYVGGSGINLKTKLPEQIEHLIPDYDLYGVDFSMGFTSRGCIRKCPFCIVPKKEGWIRDNAPILEFWRQDHKKIILLDNNFLASPKWKYNLEFLIQQNLKVNFNQGLDIRLITEENAKLLSEVRYYDWKFKIRRLHFAWDLMEYESSVYRGIEILRDNGIPKRHLMFYVLVGFNTTLEEDLYRIEKLKELGVKPYVMPFNGKKNPLTRWVNRRYYEFIPFEKFGEKESY